ncbi:hypothetical protein [Asticcacaulis sp. EMRT-3]|uniref:hypothetical protein n=1 Tax=Asticcacaulis sp. EMRT-3 TaxID=3040349 RepID=UPI0024AF703F|nr:hypothetical protein [Asticcacaulis sp. EMRT-3]MDI7776051.1 hypothetical protein [Asticcacaulis sp. EMRT-3]
MTDMAPLHLRQPETPWLIAATAAALCLHGALWFVARTLAGDAAAGGEACRQMVPALGWLICALVVWKVFAPSSRLHAVFSAWGCTLAVVVLGSLAALIRLVLLQGYAPSHELLSSFSMLSLMLVLAQLIMALPSILLLQGIALTRRSA